MNFRKAYWAIICVPKSVAEVSAGNETHRRDEMEGILHIPRDGKIHMEVSIMAIEPIGTAMTFQAQPLAAPKPAPVEKPAELNHTQVADPAAQLDATTRVVENAQEKGDSDTYNGNPREDRQPTSEQIRKAVEKINQSKLNNSEAVFGIHEETNRVTIKIVDKKTKETIKELPPEKTLDMIARVWEMAGILVDEKR